MNSILVFTTSERYNLSSLKKFLEKEKIKFRDYKDFILFQEKDNFILLFLYGSGVIFDIDNIKIINKFKEFEVNTYELIYEKYNYISGGDFKIVKDKFYFPYKLDEFKIAIGYALSQSIKLNYFEDKIFKEIKKTSFIPKEIAEYGSIRLKKEEVSKLRGNVFMSKSLLNLQYEFLDEPEYFWDYPDYLKIYEKTKVYLDVPNRIEVLNKKMDVLEELFNMLSDELKYKHEAFLEWIIIILIVIEVIISILHEVLKVF